MISRIIVVSLFMLVSSPSYSESLSHSHGGKAHLHPLPTEGINHRHNKGEKGSVVTSLGANNSELTCKVLAKSKWENSYEDPKGVDFGSIDPKKAIPACEKAVNENKTLLNQARLIRALIKGKRYKDAFELNKDISDVKNPIVQNNFGYMYLTGKGVEKDVDKALKWYEKAAKSNDPVAQYNIGSVYQTGWGVEKDVDKALKWYKKAADRGYTNAMYKLGAMYINDEGVQKNLSKALDWFKKAADRGNSPAMNEIGYMYHTGKGVEIDKKEAKKWYKKASDNGSVIAMYNLGALYSMDIDVVKSRKRAILWYRLAANEGHKDAQIQLDKIYDAMKRKDANERKRIAANKRKRIVANEKNHRNPTKEISFGEMLLGLYVLDVVNAWSKPPKPYDPKDYESSSPKSNPFDYGAAYEFGK